MNWGTASKFSQLSGYANEIENEAAGSPSGKSRSGRNVPRWRATSAVRCHTRLTKHWFPSLTEVVTLAVRCSVVLMVGWGVTRNGHTQELAGSACTREGLVSESTVSTNRSQLTTCGAVPLKLALINSMQAVNANILAYSRRCNPGQCSSSVSQDVAHKVSPCTEKSQ